jgi:CRP-like cAMP-binding protein
VTGELTFGDVALRESVARLALFADLDSHELDSVLRSMTEAMYDEGEWVIRRGHSSVGLHVIVDGVAGVVIEHDELATLSKGSFFGEISALLDEPTTADVVARTPLRCLVVAPEDAEGFLMAHPRVMFRMLQAEARRIRTKDDLRL